MRRLSSILVTTAMLITVALTVLYAGGRTQNANRRPDTANTSQRSDNQANERDSVKLRKGKELVKRLPVGAEGVELKDGLLRLKPGYKFEKHDDGTVAVANMRGGSGGLGAQGGSWACQCMADSGGTCQVIISGNILFCTNGTCPNCVLGITVDKITTGVMRY